MSWNFNKCLQEQLRLHLPGSNPGLPNQASSDSKGFVGNTVSAALKVKNKLEAETGIEERSVDLKEAFDV